MLRNGESGFCGETVSLDGQTLDSVYKLARLQVSRGKTGTAFIRYNRRINSSRMNLIRFSFKKRIA